MGNKSNKEEQVVYKIFLFTVSDDEFYIYNLFKSGFSCLTKYVEVINHNIDVVINEKSRVTAITINRKLNSNVTEFFNNQLDLIYKHFYLVNTSNNNSKLLLFKMINKIKSMYDIEFIAQDEKMAAAIIKCILNICKCCKGILLNYDGSKLVTGDNKIILDDNGNSDVDYELV